MGPKNTHFEQVMAEQGLHRADYTWQKVAKSKKKVSKSTGAYATHGSPGPELPLVLQLTPEDDTT